MKKFLLNNFYVIAAVLLLGAFTYNFLNYLEEEPTDGFRQVTVQSGDSLWDISERYYESYEKQAEFVAWVENNNDISGSNVQTGERIYIPVKAPSNDIVLLAEGN